MAPLSITEILEKQRAEKEAASKVSRHALVGHPTLGLINGRATSSPSSSPKPNVLPSRSKRGSLRFSRSGLRVTRSNRSALSSKPWQWRNGGRPRPSHIRHPAITIEVATAPRGVCTARAGAGTTEVRTVTRHSRTRDALES